MSVRVLVGALPLLALSLLPASAPGQVRDWRPEERVLVSSFDDVGAVARSDSRLFAATGNGLTILDFFSDLWELPSTAEDGYPTGEEVTALAVDRLERTVWLGTRGGELHAYRMDFERWESRGSPGVGGIDEIVPHSGDRGPELFLRAAAGWHRMSSFSGVARPVASERLPPEVARAEGSPVRRLRREDPFFRSAEGTLTLDGTHRRWPVTDWVRDPRAHRYWLGTAGGNVWLYDSRKMQAEPRDFGLATRGVTALALDGDGVWHGGDGRGLRRGVTWGSRDLQRWRRHEAGIEPAPTGPVHEIEATADGVWFAAAGGLHFLDARTERWLRLAGDRALPSGRVLAVERDPEGGGVWAGTARGLARISVEAGGDGRRPVARVEGIVFEGREVRALERVDAGLWVALPDGPYFVTREGTVGLPGDSTGGAPPAGVEDFAVTAEGVWALTSDALWRWDGAAWHGPLRESSLGGVGRLLRLRAAGEALWVAGSGGVARRDPVTRSWLHLAVGPTISRGPAADVLPDGDRVWIATPLGTLRVDWALAR